MLIAQITDTHIREPGLLCSDRVDTAAFLARAIERLGSMSPKPDLVILTGDLVDHGAIAEYVHLKSILSALQIPYYLVMGNHDCRDSLREVFQDQAYLPSGPFIQYAVEGFLVRLVVLDTHVPGRGEGSLCDERLSWLDRCLSEQPDRATVLAMHHPPFPSGNALWDRFGLEGRDQLSAVVSKHRNIEAILCGHLHRPTQARFAGTLAMTCPSTAHQLHFGLGESPFGFDLEPPALQLHLWNGRSMVTHTVLIDRYEGPYSFGDGRKIAR